MSEWLTLTPGSTEGEVGERLAHLRAKEPPETLAQRALAVAQALVGLAEEGNNEGPLVEWALAPWTRREPGPWARWCAAFASTCYVVAGAPHDWQRLGSTSCDALWGRCVLWSFRDLRQVQPGDLVFFGAEGDLMHVGLVVALEAGGRQLRTIEGNAGNEVRVRTYPLDFPKLYGAVRLPW